MEDVVHPIRRDQAEQEKLIAVLNPVLQRDGYSLMPAGRVSRYPLYRVQETPVLNIQPADEIISQVLNSYDEVGVHHAWRKALDRRGSDPEGAITAAKTLLETVCKHIIDNSGQSYGENDDLPKLYATASECLNLAPTQHSEKVFKSILGNCQSVVNNLAALRNKLGNSHGQGKKHVRPQARHAELAVNLAGSIGDVSGVHLEGSQRVTCGFSRDRQERKDALCLAIVYRAALSVDAYNASETCTLQKGARRGHQQIT